MKVFQCLIHSFLDIFWLVVRIPELAGNEQLFAVNTSSLDTLADLIFVVIDGCGVNVTVS